MSYTGPACRQFCGSYSVGRQAARSRRSKGSRDSVRNLSTLLSARFPPKLLHQMFCGDALASCRGYDDDDYEGPLGEESAVSQQLLLPTNEDPKLWIVQCKVGHEREVALQLLQKSMSLYKTGNPLAIKSAVALDHLKGYLYVEAEKESHVSGV